MKTLLLSSAIGALLATPTVAQAYNAEVTGGALYSEASAAGEKVDADGLQIRGTWYLNPVQTGNGPLAEAAFLNKASSVSAGYQHLEMDDSDANADADGLDLALHWVAPYNLIVDLGFSRLQIDVSDDEGDSDEGDLDTLFFGLGTYLNDTSTLNLRFTQIEAEDIDIADTIGLNYRGLFGAGNKFRLDAALVRTELDDELGGDDSTGAAVAFTYYHTTQLGFGFSYARDTLLSENLVGGSIALDGVDSDMFGLKLDWFANKNLHFVFNYVNGEIEDVDLDSLTADVSYRF